MTSRQIPVLLLLFNRPDTTRLLIDALREIKPAKVYIAQDWPRHDTDKKNIELVRIELEKIDWECEKMVLFREKNLGCYDAVTSGIDWFFSEAEFGIILEDDCIPAKSFFDFCFQVQNSLGRDDISLISGSNFLSSHHGDSSFLTNHSPLLWWWATWRAKWKFFESIKKEKDILLSQINSKLCQYNILDRKALMSYLSWDYWDADWYLICLFHSWKAIVPPKNQITNVGAVGIHSGRPWPYHFLERYELSDSTLTFSSLDIHWEYDNQMIWFMRRMFIYGLIERFLSRIGLLKFSRFFIKHISTILYSFKR